MADQRRHCESCGKDFTNDNLTNQQRHEQACNRKRPASTKLVTDFFESSKKKKVPSHGDQPEAHTSDAVAPTPSTPVVDSQDVEIITPSHGDQPGCRRVCTEQLPGMGHLNTDDCCPTLDLSGDDLTAVRCDKAATVAALMKIRDQWVNREFKELPPVPGQEGQRCLEQLQKLQKEYPPEVGNDFELRRDKRYVILMRNNVNRHYSTTASHRMWLTWIYNLVACVAKIELPQNMGHLVDIHDVSKYGIPEALGYGVMFGKTGAYRQLDDIENEAWKESLEAHYANNQHHPEYTRGVDMPNEYAQESRIDMLASRTERELSGVSYVTPAAMFTIHEQYLRRYTQHDKLFVEKLVEKWSSALEKVVSSTEEQCVARVKEWKKLSNLKLVMEVPQI